MAEDDQRQTHRQHPLEDHQPSLLGNERRAWPRDLDEAGFDARAERGCQLSDITRRVHRRSDITRDATLRKREQFLHFGGQRGGPGLERPDLLLQGQEGLQLLPEQTEGGGDRALGLGHGRGDFLQRLRFVQRGLPGVPVGLFRQPLFLQGAEAPHFGRHGLAEPGQGFACRLDLRLQFRQSACSRVARCFQGRQLLSSVVHAGGDFPELTLNLRESPVVGNRFFQAGEPIGQGSRQGDEVGQLRDGRLLFRTRSRGLRAAWG